jgi:hypothetical protein
MKPSPSLSTKSLVLQLIALLVLVLGLASTALAQIDRAELEGTVTDPSSRVIVGATVKVLATDTGLTAEQPSNSKGYYRFPGLAVGQYTVTVSATGFKEKAVEDVVLRIGQTHTLDVQLAVGTINEKVDVQATNAPADRSSAEAATVIDREQIANLPNNGRDWASFTLLAPFAQDDGGGDQRTIRFAGRARDDNNFSIDGVDAGGIQEQAQKSQTRLQISQDAIEEYRVNSALYDAEYGTQAGGQIDVETKHGTNDYHGSVFTYFRNSYFDARNFNDFDLNGKAAIPPFRLGQYGLTFGGPIKKDKTFFFLSYEGLRQFQGTTQQFIVPSGFCCGQRANSDPNNPIAPLTTSFQQYVLSTSPQMCSILQAFPWRKSVGTINGCAPRFTYPDAAFQWQGNPNNLIDPNADSNTDQVIAATPTVVHEDSWLVRIDHQFSEKTLLYGRAQRDISLVDAPNGASLPGDKLQTINHPANYSLALQHAFSQNVFNEAKVYVNRAPFHNPQSSVLPYAVSTNTFVGLNNNNADIEVGTTYGVVDNLTWVRGRHAFKTGMEIRRVRLNQGKTADNNLSFADSSGNLETAFVNAALYDIHFTAPWCCHKLRRTFYMPYFQDDWKVTPNFTLNLGLRWEYYGVAHEADNRTTVFDVNEFHGVCFGSGSTWRNSLPSPIPSPTNPSITCPTNPALYNPDYKNFDPRVSIAWAPNLFHGKTVIRSGFGIYHGAAQNDDLNAGLESDRFTANVHFDPSTSGTPLVPAYQQTTPDLSGLGFTIQQQPRALQRHGRRDLYAETWGLTIDHELPGSFLASAQYLGSRGVRLFSRGGVNFCITKPDINGNCTRFLDPYFPGITDPYQSVDYKSDIGSSTYNALGLSLERRFSSGLSFQSRYTWSHSINDGSVGGGESNGPENVNCLSCDKGPSVYDIRQNFVANGVYELPFGAGKTFLDEKGLLDKFVGGWSLSSIGLWHTGHPLTITMGIANTQLPDGNDQTTQRPDLVPGVPVQLSGVGPNHTLRINPAAFAPPPLDPGGVVTGFDVNNNPICALSCGLISRFGNAPNGVIRALNSWQMDLALTKSMRISERVSAEFAIQAFNIFNHVQLGDPNGGNLNFNYVLNGTSWALQPPSTLGVITSTNNFNNNNDNAASPNTGTGLPRQLQFMVRATF